LPPLDHEVERAGVGRERVERGAALLAAIAAEHQHRGHGAVLEPLLQVSEEAEREAVREVDVVEDQQQRPVAGERVQRVAQAPEHARSRGRRRQRLGLGQRGDPRHLGDLGAVERQHRRADAEHAIDLAGAGRDAVLDQRLEQLTQRLERPGARRAPAGDGGRARVGAELDGLERQPRLAGPALARDQHEAADLPLQLGLARRDRELLEPRDEPAEHVVTTDERGPIEERLRRGQLHRPATPLAADRREHRVDRLGRADALIALLDQQPGDQLVERRRQAHHQVAGRHGRVHEVPGGDLPGRPAERQAPRHDAVEDAAERVEIAARVEQLAAKLLRRHVADRARHADVLEHIATVGADLGRDAEVDQHRQLTGAQEDVLGLEVAVDHALAVDERQRVTDAPQDGEHAIEVAGDRRARQRLRRQRLG
jgi:hypothetical protein